MAEKKLTEMSLDELRTKEKSLKFVMGLFGGVLVALVVIGAYMAFSKKGSVVFTVLPVAFLPLFIGLVSQGKKIKEEIAKRS